MQTAPESESRISNPRCLCVPRSFPFNQLSSSCRGETQEEQDGRRDGCPYRAHRVNRRRKGRRESIYTADLVLLESDNALGPQRRPQNRRPAQLRRNPTPPPFTPVPGQRLERRTASQLEHCIHAEARSSRSRLCSVFQGGTQLIPSLFRPIASHDTGDLGSASPLQIRQPP
jgi:hypothetical protein